MKRKKPLSAQQRQEIASASQPVSYLAEKFGVSQPTVRNIRTKAGALLAQPGAKKPVKRKYVRSAAPAPKVPSNGGLTVSISREEIVGYVLGRINPSELFSMLTPGYKSSTHTQPPMASVLEAHN